MINRARLTQCLPWHCLEKSSIEPDRNAIAAAVADWLDTDLIAPDGTMKRRKPSELTESLEDAKKSLKALKRHLKAAGIERHTLPMFDTSGEIQTVVYKDILSRLEYALDLEAPAPHPAQNTGKDQWQRAVMRGFFWNLQANGLVDWRAIPNKDQATFMSAVLIEAGHAHNLPASPWTTEKWRKSRDGYFTMTESGYMPSEFV